MDAMMKLALVVLITTALAVAALAWVKQQGRRGLTADVYTRGELLSAAERHFLVTLDQAIGSEQRAFAKVRVADLVTLKPGLSQKARRGALNRVAAKHFDFVVCAAELNDSSHDTPRAKQRDELLAAVCRQVGLPLVMVRAAASYSAAALWQQIETTLVDARTTRTRAENQS